MKTNKESKTIFVGVSGGVDSSVSAALLQEQGHDVVGVFIRTWQPDWIECTWRDERRDAMRVCAHLNIPFMELNLEQEYKTGVADYMISEYRRGRTPNPDVMCNKTVKFGAFLDWALENGADAIATGHYTQNIFNESTGQWELHRGIDRSKDQSYFLWTLTQSQLEHIIFPVGHLPKAETRRLAEKFGLPTATKKDSQGICFIGQIDMKDFLRHYIAEIPGDVLDESGEKIGTHNGALFFTLGERHGFTITQKGTEDQPYYVIAKDIDSNTITVSHDLVSSTGDRVYTLTDCNWITQPGAEVTGQIRYHGEHKSVVLEGDRVTFDQSDRTIAPGQSLVCYDGDICLGGGVIA